ncbi:SNF2-related protein [Macrophomina phaseolina MS6]|uniref:SNF2-related protein n=1 Tax=Macrophomina phaseolina (strain MS6) TaxID=1126212 RepID=K2S103_MACPH|nr:SNF2-related protein [Macrophomina phaseolina MS6]
MIQFEDPLDWSIDQIVEALCISRSWWEEGRPDSRLPDPRILEQAIREQEINGYALLTYFDSMQKFKEDLGVKTIGQIAAITWAIDKLREQSPKYTEYLATQRSISGVSAPRSLPGSTTQSIAGSYSCQPPVPSWLDNQPTSCDSLRAGLATPAHEIALPAVLEAEEAPNEFASDTSEKITGSVKRPWETILQGADGKKRRKLFFPEPSAASIPPPAAKEIRSKTVARNPGKKFPVDEIFYDGVPFGRVLEDDDDLDVLHLGEVPPGVGSYVYRQYLHFVRNSERKELFQDGKKIVAVHPYRSQILPEGQPRSATVIEVTNAGAKATRQNALRLQSSIPYDSSVSYDEDSHEVYSFAARWTTDNDKVLPALGDSDDEGYSPSLEAEIEAEERERALQEMKRGRLSQEEVTVIVQDKIKEMIDTWKRKKLPFYQHKARTIWRKGRRGRERLMLRRAAAAEAERINSRLAKLCEAIINEEWHGRDEVLRQCIILEESISQREEELWRMSVWSLKVEPAPAPAPTFSRRIAKKSVERDDKYLGEEAGDWVNSDSELESDDLRDFVEIDQDVKETSPEMSPVVTACESLGHSDDMGQISDNNNMPDAPEDEPIRTGDTDIDMAGAPTTASETTGSIPNTPKRLRKSKPEYSPRSEHSVIDLTALSDGSGPSPSSKKTRVVLGSQPGTGLSKADPENSAFSEISAWEFSNLQERSDKKRLVLKVIRDVMNSKDYRRARKYVTLIGRKMLYDQIWQAIEAICSGQELNGMAAEEWDCLFRLARLYACWKHANQKHWLSPWEELSSTLSKIMEKRDKSRFSPFNRDFNNFLTFTTTIFEKFPSQKLDSSSVDLSSDGEEQGVVPANTPHKKRKNKVMQSASAISLRKSAQKRAEAQIEKEREFQERIGSSQSKSDHLIVNPGEYGKSGAIYIHRSIGGRIKTHQIEGVRFMWREIVEAGHTDPQGCLLAHTMGLGKTMQAITLLVTIADAAKSPNEDVRSQIPEELRRVQTLILCPASLVDNWVDELYAWIPKSLSDKIGHVRSIAAESDLTIRLKKIRNWDQKGGILVMSYEMFRTLLSGKWASKFSNEERQELARQLFERPSIIIADEAHKMKNSSSSLRGLVERFSSKSRVALTGSPLANNLIEYWSMIDWISPGYLGSLKEFKANFVEPIEEGLYKESTKYEHRKALKKLRVLKNEIGPKINRADITALKDDLKPKVEFLITVPLTSLQEDLYRLCVQFVLTQRQEKVSNTKLWQWMHLLNTICTHPAAFYKLFKVLQARGYDGKQVFAEESEGNDLEDTSTDELALNLDSKQDLFPVLIEQAISKCTQAPDLDSPRHSFKTSILMNILDKSKSAGDRVLVFSQQIATLDYLERLLTKERYKFIRLDGKTKMSNRPELLEKFNEGNYDLFLISTRAGGTGFNLPGANRVIILDFGFNPQNEEQAIGRAYRLGQEKEVFVYRILTGGTFEPKVWNKALFKTQLASRVIDTRNPERHAEKMRDYFFEPKLVEQEDLTEHQGKDRKVLDRILARRDGGNDPGVRAITTTETLMTEDLDAVLDDQENEEVKKMIEAERLRKEDPKAYEQYMRANPAIDDSRNNPAFPLQRALLQNAAARNGPAPIPSTTFARSDPRSYITFGNMSASTAPARSDGPAQELTHRSDGLPSSDAGINNAGPLPASMRYQVPPQAILKEIREPDASKAATSAVKEALQSSPKETQESRSPKQSQEISLPGRRGSPELGDDYPPSDPGVNNSGPALPGARPLAIQLIASSPMPRRGDTNEGSSGSDARQERDTNQPGRHRQFSDQFVTSMNRDRSLAGDRVARLFGSPSTKEVRSPPNTSLRDELNTAPTNRSSATDKTDPTQRRESTQPEGSDARRQKIQRPSWLPEVYAVFKRQETRSDH